MKYKSVIVTRTGGPEVLHVIENDLRAPFAGEVRIKILTAAVCSPDVTVRTGQALYSGTPLGQKVPFVPGYAIIGVVDALGEGVTGVALGERVGAVTVTGGYSEYLRKRGGNRKCCFASTGIVVDSFVGGGSHRRMRCSTC